ncbi:MAG: geranylgeranylglycerol-phosphate geranylgeranyltransferase [Bacteroidales bacterium]|nr:geranylgeranylglycerol-phosphate geranylgeranyltransferase [Bacteroidales bacterium]
MNKIKAFFKLTRWSNLLMIAIMMLIVYYCLMSPLFVSGIASVMPSPPAFLLLLISLVFIVAGGYVINDLFDVEIDKLNKPDKLIVTKNFTEKETKISYIMLTTIGLASGLVSSLMIEKNDFLTLFALLSLLVALLYSYSSTYKKKFFVGNLIVSLSVAFAVFLPWLFELLYLSDNLLVLSASKELMMGVLPFVLIYTAFAFLMTLIREIIKDAEDYKGDSVTRCRTIPIVLGINKTKTILCIMVVALMLLLFYYSFILFNLKLYVAFAMMLLIVVCSIFLLVKIYKADVKNDFHFMSGLSKIMMLIGILSMLFI